MFHVFLHEAVEDWRGCRNLIKNIASNYRLPYFTISPTFSVCPIHGYLSGEHFTCPKCKKEFERDIREKIAALELEKKDLLTGRNE